MPEGARGRVNSLLRRLSEHDAQLERRWLVDALTAEKRLTELLLNKTEFVSRRIDELTDGFGASLGESLVVISECADEKQFFEIPAKLLRDIAETLGRLGMTEVQMRHMLKKCPKILVHADALHIWQVANQLANFFTAAQVGNLLQTAPEQILFTPFDDLEARYEYLHFDMGVSQPKVHKSALTTDGDGWLNLTLGEVKLRHEFLRRTGAWLLPDPRQPQLPLPNPSVSLVLAGDESRVASAAGVSPIEWTLFRQMYEGTKRFSDYDPDVYQARPVYRRPQKNKHIRKRKDSDDFDDGDFEVD